VYWRGGKLLPHIKEPGLRLKLPLLDVYSPIQVTLQTDKVTDIPCGTKGGVMVSFAKVEVRLAGVHLPSCNGLPTHAWALMEVPWKSVSCTMTVIA
jgi:hypothetical protein